MISKDEEKLIFLRLELNECQKVVHILREAGPRAADDLKEWENKYKDLADRVFEMTALLGVDI